jgi:DMSO/TMAO reductase YedYZ heme-binding membrane subunit
VDTLRNWTKGVRLYVAIASGLITIETIWWAHTVYSGTILYPTRLEEVFAWLATGLLALALAIGPFFKLFPHIPAQRIIFDARRMVGVSAAWFASLHVGIAYISLFNIANPFGLPSEYKLSFAIGAVALLILLAMAATSFDKAITKLGIWWFRLHRLIYLAGFLVLLHAFMIGTHATQTSTLVAISIMSTLIVLAYVWLTYVRKGVSKLQGLTVFFAIIALALVLNYGFRQDFTHHSFSGPTIGAQKG